MKKEYKEIQDFIDDVHGQISIKEFILDMGIISKNDFKGQFLKCVFHDSDNTPSLQITDNFWKCYGCGEKGDLFAFLQRYYNIDFIDSVKKVADILNVNISNIKYKFDQKYDKLKIEWSNYLKEMDKAPDNIKKFKRDYFPQEIGYDSRINYLVLPLKSKTGSILGFTKRRIDFLHEKNKDGKYDSPKWKHSSLKDSLISQCHNVFNLAIASPEIRKKQFVIVTEGPKDVIAYQRINFNNSICVCGTYNSSNVWDIIFPVKNIILSMDNDKAGIEATIKTILYLSKIFDLKYIEVVVLPKSCDPYDIVEKEGNDKLKYYFDNKIPAVEFVIRNGSISEVNDLYNDTIEFNKIYVMKNICKIKGFSITEAESWLSTSLEKNENKKILDEKEELLSILNGNSNELINCKDPLEQIEKAKRILKLKYGIEY